MTRRLFRNINKLMALRKCPYCKAIIDESLEYCSNCGTQLLFPEDEHVEEEIPGEKIVEEEDEEREEAKYEPGDYDRATDEEMEEPPDIAEEELEEKEAAPEEGREDKAEEEKEMPESKDASLPEEEPRNVPPSGSLKFDTADLDQLPDARTRDFEEIQRTLKSFREKAGAEHRTPPLEEEKEEEIPKLPRQELPEEQPEEITPEKPPSQDFGIEEEDKMVRGEAGEPEPRDEELTEDEEKEKEDIGRFLDSVKKERQQQALAFEKSILSTPPEEVGQEKEPTPDKLIELEEREKEDIEKFVGEVKKEREAIKVETSGLEGDLPPWAEKIKEAPPAEFEETPEKALKEAPGLEEAVQEEEESEEKIWQAETTPEEVTPFETIPEEPSLAGEEASFPEKFEEEEPLLKEREEREIQWEREGEHRPLSKLSIWFASRAFDILTTGACWLITLWIASRLAGVSLFQLISVSGLQVLAFYLIIFFVYCIFFLLFLGETLGHYIFSQE